MDYIPPPKFVLPIFSPPPVIEEEGGASAVEEVPREDAATNQIVEKENRQVLAPLPLDLLRDRTMREEHRIPHHILKAGRILIQNKVLVMIFCLAFSVDSSNIPQEAVHNI